MEDEVQRQAPEIDPDAALAAASEKLTAIARDMHRSLASVRAAIERARGASEELRATLDAIGAQRLLRYRLDPDTTSTLMSLHREGRETDFRFLARANGVTRAKADILWAGLNQAARVPSSPSSSS